VIKNLSLHSKELVRARCDYI